MTSYGVLDFRLVPEIMNSSNVYTTLENIVATIECMAANSTTVVYTDEFFYQESSGIDFASWLYNYDMQPELRDIKKELSLLINKSTAIDEELYLTYLVSVDELDVSSGLIMSICCKELNVLYVSSPSRYWSAKQWFLSEYVKKSEFVSEASTCFPNLYFHNNVTSSFHTLNGNFTTVRPIIVEHLQALNAFKERFAELSDEGVGYREMCKEFEGVYEIACSPQASRETTHNLLFDFTNTKTTASERLCCELHTKLKWPGMDKVHQDRIYFHPGKSEIENGKVLIVHIGTHQ